MTHYINRITIEKEGKQYYAYGEDLPGVYGVGLRPKMPRPAFSTQSESTFFSARKPIARFPDLPGVYGIGTSMEEAKTSILDAILIYLVQRKNAGHALPL